MFAVEVLDDSFATALLRNSSGVPFDLPLRNCNRSYLIRYLTISIFVVQLASDASVQVTPLGRRFGWLALIYLIVSV